MSETSKQDSITVYPFFWKMNYLLMIADVLIILFFLVRLGRLFVSIQANPDLLTPGRIMVILLLDIAGWIIIHFSINFFVDFKTDHRFLYVRYFLGYLPVAWEDLLFVKPMKWTFGIGQNFWIVGVKPKALTRMHILYGMLYGFTLHRGFILANNSVKHYDELLATIQQRCLENS